MYRIKGTQENKCLLFNVGRSSPFASFALFAVKFLPPGLAPGLRPHLGLNGYKPFVLLYTTGGGKKRNAEGMLPFTQNARQFL